MIYPPYCDLFSVMFTGENENECALCAKKFFEIMVELNKNEYKEVKLVALGPTQAKISKINNNFRYRILLKTKNNKNVRMLITEILKQIKKLKEFKNVSLSVDLNPDDLS